MPLALQISYHPSAPSESLNALIREKAADLEHFYSRITHCHVFVESPGSHHRKGAGSQFRVGIELGVPGQTLVVSRRDDPIAGHDDAYLAVNDAFHALRRQLQDFARRQRHDVKRSAGRLEK